MKKILLIILLAAMPPCYGGSLSWFGMDADERPDSEFRKTKNDFAGLLLITPDTDWEEKWSTPSAALPDLTETESVKYGGEIAILTFFMNPKPDENNEVDVQCSLMVTSPNRTIALYQQGIGCLKGELQGGPGYIRLSPFVLNYIGEK